MRAPAKLTFRSRLPQTDDIVRNAFCVGVGNTESMSIGARQPRKDASANRERVIDAAIELVRRDGERVPMATIAQHAGVGVGTVYRHFATRQELFEALVQRSFDMALANARAASDVPGSALDGVRAFLAATLRDRDRFVLPLHGGPVIFNASIRDVQSEIRSVLQQLLDRGRVDGQLRGDLTPVDLIVAASTLSRPLPNADNWDALALRQIDLLMGGFGPQH